MKYALPVFLLAAYLPVQHATAQTGKSFSPQHHPQTQRILDAQVRSELSAAKTSAQKLRLKGYSYRLLGQPVIDSASFHYTGTRGSDSLKNATWDEYALERSVLTPAGKHGALADSVVSLRAGGGGALQVEHRFLYQYDALGNVTSAEQRISAGFNCNKYTSTYSPAGLQETRVMWQQSGSCGQHAAYSWAIYNSAGSILADSSNFAKVRYYYSGGGTVLDSFLTTYSNSAFALGWKYARGVQTYNSAGLMTSFNGTYFDSLLTLSQAYLTLTYTYDAQGRMDSVVQWDGPVTSVPSASWKYNYTGTFRRPTNIRQYFPNSGNLTLAARWGYHLNSTGNWDTVYFYNVSNGVDELVEKDPVVYNSEGFIDYLSGYYYDASTGTYSPTPYDRNQYYYETYNDGTGVDNVEGTAASPVAYPVPFSTVLNIDVAKDVAWTCLDTHGRTVAQGIGQATVATGQWAPGLYVLRSAGKTTKVIKQ